MNDLPFFTIITVSLNCEDDIQLTVKSVLEQQFQSYEYIVKDGGSKDGTLKILSDAGITVITKPDTGIYDAMNQALELTNGKYICFLNAGDIFKSDSVLNDIYLFLHEKNLPDFLYGDIFIKEQHPSYNEINRGVIYSSKLTTFYLYRKMICHQAWFVKSSVYRELNGFNLNYSYSADYDLLLRMILCKKKTYKHFPSFIVNFKGYGVTSNNIIMESENERIRRNHLNRFENTIYKWISSSIHFLSIIVIYPLYSKIPASWKHRINGF